MVETDTSDAKGINTVTVTMAIIRPWKETGTTDGSFQWPTGFVFKYLNILSLIIAN